MNFEHQESVTDVVKRLAARQHTAERVLKVGLEMLEQRHISQLDLDFHFKSVRMATRGLKFYKTGLEHLDEDLATNQMKLTASCESLSSLVDKFKSAIKGLFAGKKKVEVSKNLDELEEYIQSRYLNEEWVSSQKFHSPFTKIKADDFSKYLSIHGKVPDNIFDILESDSKIIVKHCTDFASQLTKSCRDVIELEKEVVKAEKSKEPEEDYKRITKKFNALKLASKSYDAFKSFRTHVGLTDDISSIHAYKKKSKDIYAGLKGEAELKALPKGDIAEVGKLMQTLLKDYRKVYDAFDEKVLAEFVDQKEVHKALEKVLEPGGEAYEVEEMFVWLHPDAFMEQLAVIDAHASVMMSWIKALETWISRSVKEASE